MTRGLLIKIFGDAGQAGGLDGLRLPQEMAKTPWGKSDDNAKEKDMSADAVGGERFDVAYL
ncbi:MAG: hypothetical protein WB646_19060, partial [Steroidobacteraceae bacterium]